MCLNKFQKIQIVYLFIWKVMKKYFMYYVLNNFNLIE